MTLPALELQGEVTRDTLQSSVPSVPAMLTPIPFIQLSITAAYLLPAHVIG